MEVNYRHFKNIFNVGLKVTQQSQLLPFAFSPPTLFFHFFVSFFPFTRHFSGKYFRTAGLDGSADG